MKTIISLFGIGILAFSISCSNTKKEVVLRIGQGIHHDDFDHFVDDFRVTKTIGTELAQANFTYYIITFSVANQALRVSHVWDNKVAYLIDEDGVIYENKPALQQKLNAISPFGLQETYTTEHQTSDSTKFVFEVPEKKTNLYLMVRGKTLMGDFFDGNEFEKTKVKLF